jgi:hypothetical protein
VINNEVERQFGNELLNDETVSRRLVKASFFSPLETRNQKTDEPYVTPQEREAEKLEQCRTAGRQGGRTRSELWAPVREFARRMFVEHWKSSTAKTAYAIADMVVDYARQRGLNMSPSNAVRTISKWIRDGKNLGQR